ncbi:aldehyde dehydrogenase family protein [Luteithermobacter gelatinilyticus]|uniref:aldehyde dehydrogenase family protein n=1 Tax=Luteithermobacter gelatinilyticus TaxID=2582913 RepID=UPI001106ABF4|nr:aldehyde dehydrogenase family protein [Luteithermobacter gelatinilyticus]
MSQDFIGKNFIGGAWVPASNGGTFERRNPADNEDVVGHFPASTPEDAKRAVEGVDQGRHDWAATDPEKRMTVLEKAADLILERVDDLARELTREEGKPLGSATMEWKRTAANFRLYAGEALRSLGETFPVAGNSLVCSIREPVGVVLAITPWNFPVSIPSRKIGPALATGNGVVFKPSEVTPLSGQRMVEILLEAGVPEGAIALVQGGGAELGTALVTAPAVKAVTFTGSFATGSAIHQAAGPSKRLQLEMGGKNPCIVLEDADTERAAQIIAQGAFNLTGQACTATSRAFVMDSIYDEVLEKVVNKARAIKVGNGLDKNTKMGPLATQAQFDKVREMIEVGKAEGLRMAYGADDLETPLPQNGFYVAPTVFADVPNSSRLAQEEIFGPVVCLHRVNNYEDAIRQANTVEYGLAASLVTRDMGRALSFAHDIEAGVIKINSATGGVALTAPFGGIKHSSNQTYKEQAGHGVMDFYTTTKTVYLAN